MVVAVNEELSSGPYQGNGATTVFDYEFTIYADVELDVERENADGTISQLVLDTDYTVQPSGGSYPAQGTITLAAPLAATARLVIKPAITRSQDRGFSNQGSISLDEIEAALDKLTSMCRELFERTTRAVTVTAFNDAQDLETLQTNITTLVALEDNVNTLAGLSAEIAALAAVDSDITTLGGLSAEITSLAARAVAISTLAAIESDIADAAAIAADIAEVASLSAEIQALAAGSYLAIQNLSVLNDFTIESTGSFKLPIGTTAQAGTQAAGTRRMRWNTDKEAPEVWDGTQWRSFYVEKDPVDRSGSYTHSTWYPNNTGRPMFVGITGANAAARTIETTPDGGTTVQVVGRINGSGTSEHVSFVVMPGHEYQVNGSINISDWMEN